MDSRVTDSKTSVTQGRLHRGSLRAVCSWEMHREVECHLSAGTTQAEDHCTSLSGRKSVTVTVSRVAVCVCVS